MGMMSMLLGAGGSFIVNPLPGGSSAANRVGICGVTLLFNPDGTVTATKSPGTANWVIGPVNHRWCLITPPQTYYVRATVTSGAIDSGTTGTWLSLDTARSWAVSDPGNSSATLLIEIASDSGGNNIITSGSYTITATDIS
jgi:hypothetical protein